jgi:hypothetical protein
MRVPLNAREYVASAVRFLARLFRSQRRRRAAGGRRDDEPGFGTGDRSPLVPRPPVLAGSAALAVPPPSARGDAI